MAKKKLPKALTIAHPECPANIREHSEFIGGTEAMIVVLSEALAARGAELANSDRLA